MPTTFKAKWAAITGAGNGIGKALAIKCASLGINVILIDIDSASLSAIRSQFASQYPSVRVLTYECDISDEQQVQAMAVKFQSDCHSNPVMLHFLFNNAGVSAFTNVLKGDMKRMQKTMDINVWGIIYVTQAFLPFLQTIDENNNNDLSDKDERFIVNTSSIAGIATADSFYAVTKHGVSALSETFQSELKQYNKQCRKQQHGRGVINVSCLVPSFVRTQFLESIGKIHDIENVREQLKQAKSFHSGKPHPELWNANGIDPALVADVVFEQGIRDKLFWINTHDDWSKCCALDRFYSFYTQKFNQYEATRKIFKKYQENLDRIAGQKKAKL